MKIKDKSGSEGIKIRRQYFNYSILMLFAAFMFFLIICTVPLIWEGSFGFYDWQENMKSVVSVTAGLLLPLILLSLGNMFFFGEVICTVNDEGICYKDVFVRWEDILYIEYNIPEHTKRHHYPAYITLVCKQEKIVIASAPLFTCFFAKKYKPGVRIKLDKTILLYFGFVLVGAVIYLVKMHF